MKKLPKIARSHIAGISFAVAVPSLPYLLQAHSARLVGALILFISIISPSCDSKPKSGPTEPAPTEQSTPEPTPSEQTPADQEQAELSPVEGMPADQTHSEETPGENLLKNGGAESGDSDGWVKFPSVSTNAKAGSNAFVCKSRRVVRSEELIPINPEVRYRLSGFFKSEGAKAKMCLGLICYDANKKEIKSQHITIITGTETKLREAASKGDTVLKIENGQQWVFDKKWTPAWGCVAFDVDDSGAYSDLPNRNLSGAGLKSIRQVGGQWEVELAKPLTADFVAGTKVRQHRARGACLWVGIKQVGSDWKELKGRIAGVSERTRQPGKFWPGTKFVGVAIFIETPGFKDSVLVDEVVFSQVE